MPLFICDKCYAVENTATGWYWCRDKNQRMLGKSFPNGECYCSECCPKVFANGKAINQMGIWHGIFEKRIADTMEVKRLLKNGILVLPLNAAATHLLGGKDKAQQFYDSIHESK